MKWIKTLAVSFLGLMLMSGSALAQVSYQHIRNATGKLSYNNTVFLIDPMLAEKEGMKDLPVLSTAKSAILR